MAWLEVHQSLRDHRKIFTLADILNIETTQAIGLVISLWLWALDNAEDGDLSRVTSRTISRAAQWNGSDSDKFLEALIASGFIDRGELTLHHWDDYTGKLIAQRETKRAQNRDRQRIYRERHKTPNLKKSEASTSQKNNALHNGANNASFGGSTEHYTTYISSSEPSGFDGAEKEKTVSTSKTRQLKAIDHDADAFKAALFLDRSIRARLPNKRSADEKTLQRWASDFDKLNRLDGQSWDLISDVLHFSQQDDFWAPNIMSGAKFREKFFALQSKMAAGKGVR